MINLETLNNYELRSNLRLILQSVMRAIEDLKTLPLYENGGINPDWILAHDFLVGEFTFDTIFVEGSIQETFKKGDKYINQWGLVTPELLNYLFGGDKDKKIIEIATQIRKERLSNLSGFSKPIIVEITPENNKEQEKDKQLNLL